MQLSILPALWPLIYNPNLVLRYEGTRYFAPGNEVSRARLQNLVNEMKALGDIKGDIAFERIVMPGLTRLVE